MIRESLKLSCYLRHLLAQPLAVSGIACVSVRRISKRVLAVLLMGCLSQHVLGQAVVAWDPEAPVDAGNQSPDPLLDPKNPLKNPTIDPGPNAGVGTAGPNVTHYAADWDWGERFFTQQFAVTLAIANKCETQQKVSIFVTGQPYVTFPSEVTVQRQSVKKVEGKVKLPGPPNPPPYQPFGVPQMGWVEPPNLGPQPFGTPPPIFHQPNFTEITGQVVVWHPLAPDGENAQCDAERTTYNIGGHMHYLKPPPEEEDSGPSSLAKTDPCVVWWNTGEEPPQRLGNCTGAMRLLAEHYIKYVVPDFWRNAPKEWEWLAKFDGVGDKSISQLLDMKARGDALMAQ